MQTKRSKLNIETQTLIENNIDNVLPHGTVTSYTVVLPKCVDLISYSICRLPRLYSFKIFRIFRLANYSSMHLPHFVGNVLFAYGIKFRNC